MQVTVEKKEGIHCVLNVELPAAEVDGEVTKRIKEVAKTAKVDGFRPGKVPASMIKRKYGKDIRAEVIDKILPGKSAEALKEKALNPAGIEADITQNKEGQELKFTLNLELFPEIKIDNLDKIKIEKPMVELGETQHKEMVKKLQKQFASWQAVDREVRMEDRVVIDFVGRVDGEVFEGGSADASELVIGSRQMIPGFEEGIIGMKKGEEKTISVTFPKDYQNQELAGKEASFDVVVKEIKEAILPKIDEAFTAKLDIKGGLDAFHAELKKNMARELGVAIERSIKAQVLEGLVKQIEFEVPKALIKREIENLKRQFLDNMKAGAKKAPFKLKDLPDELFVKRAENAVKLSLILNAINEIQKFEADDQAVDAMIEETVSVYEDADEMRRHLKEDQKELGHLKAAVIEKKLVDWVSKQAEVINTPKDYFELIRRTMPNAPLQ